MISSSEFHKRIVRLCEENGTSLTAFLERNGISRSVGTSMQRAKKPSEKVAIAASKEFGVPVEWLLGLENEHIEINHSFVLSDVESKIITGLRDSSSEMRNTLIKMLAAAFDFE